MLSVDSKVVGLVLSYEIAILEADDVAVSESKIFLNYMARIEILLRGLRTNHAIQ